MVCIVLCAMKSGNLIVLALKGKNPLGFAIFPQAIAVFLCGSPAGVLMVWQEAINPIKYTGTQVFLWVKSTTAPLLWGAADARFGTLVVGMLFWRKLTVSTYVLKLCGKPCWLSFALLLIKNFFSMYFLQRIIESYLKNLTWAKDMTAVIQLNLIMNLPNRK